MTPNNLNLRRSAITSLTILIAAVAYVIGVQVTEINLGKLFTSLPKSKQILGDLIHPDVTTRNTQDTTLEVVFPVPCGSADAAQPQISGAYITTNVPCANPRDIITLQGHNLVPNNSVKILWMLPDGNNLFSVLAKTDARGDFNAQVEVRPITVTVNKIPSHLQVITSVPVGKRIPSPALKDVVNAIMVTIFMALLATTAGTIVAAPVSFLAARNIMGRSVLGKTVYTITRTVLNVTRSYDALVLATVFALWLTFGPFAGVLALSIVTVASLGKLFSEAVENIDLGPLDAVQATGGNSAQVIIYAVVPQIIPDFISYIIYHWDINVRISTILGFVGGGGIGYYLSQRINLLQYRQAGTAIWAIVAVVWAMDFLSAEIRKKVT
ncbi:MAG TPA: phosphonate ABC transporter, permease protein PhnE [Anaerolineales bacterium]|nr:phosphonate ABC transporter, permease protein PhnE [Anaerolineales bacterium]